MPDAGPSPQPVFRGLTLAEARRAAMVRLAEAGFEDAEREARHLVLLATGLTAERLLLDERRAVSESEADALSVALRRRLGHEPLSRIRGEREFYGRTFAVTPAVLDPRPETETLVDLVLDWVDRSGGRSRPLRLVDVGTGSGCLAVTLLAELPNATALATDISAAALAVAARNAERNGVAARMRCEQRRSLEGLGETFDVLVSNPPYIPAGDLAALEPAVRGFDPPAALDGGPDGLSVYRDLAAGAGTRVPAGLIAVEVGAGQAPAVARLFADGVRNALGKPYFRADLGGHERCVALLTHS